MNPNDLIAQQQALLNQAMQSQQHLQYAAFAYWAAGLIITAFVLYMFYARLRGIENEIMKFRIAYEFAHTPEAHSRPRHESRSEPSKQPA